MQSHPVRLTRRVMFSSGHRYWLDEKSAAENQALFGKWASRFNHGHNYFLEVAVEGHIDQETGMVVNIKTIDDVIKKEVVAAYDQKSINDEVLSLAGKAPSIENILADIEHRLTPNLPPQAKLVGLRLEESQDLYGEIDLNTQALSLTRTYEFAAAHRLHVPSISETENEALFGKCNNPAGHGHNYVLEVTVSGDPDPKTGLLVDISALDEIVHREVVDRYDHKHFNVDLPEFAGKVPTSEVVALEIFSRLAASLPIKVKRIRLLETGRSVFEVCS